MGNEKLAALIAERSRTYFGKDANYPAGWEPGGEDFFSPALMEADLMRRVLTAPSFVAGFIVSCRDSLRVYPKPVVQPPPLLIAVTQNWSISTDSISVAPGACEVLPRLCRRMIRRERCWRPQRVHMPATLWPTWPAEIMPANIGWLRLLSICFQLPNRRARVLTFTDSSGVTKQLLLRMQKRLAVAPTLTIKSTLL